MKKREKKEGFEFRIEAEGGILGGTEQLTHEKSDWGEAS